MAMNIRKKNLALTLFLFAIGLAVGVIVIEAGLSVIARTDAGKILPAIEPVLGKPDRDTGYAFVPDADGLWTRENRALIKINSLGFRDIEMSVDKPADTTRILITGDSIFEALQVEQQYIFDQIAERLFLEEGRKVQIVNMAMSGNGPLRQLTRLEKLGSNLQPDAVVMFIEVGGFVNNELSDDSVNPAYRIESAGKVVRSYGFRQRFTQRYASHIVGRSIQLMQRQSHFLRMLNNRLRQPVHKVMGAEMPILSDFLAHFESPSVPSRQVCPTKLYSNTVSNLRPSDSTKSLIRNAFYSELRNYSKTVNAPVFVHLILPLPDKDCPTDPVLREAIMQDFSRLGAAYGIKTVDWQMRLQQTIRQLPSGIEDPKRLLGFGNSFGFGHLNYFGHQVFARTFKTTVEEFLPNLD
jgi:hypothetical protein